MRPTWAHALCLSVSLITSSAMAQGLEVPQASSHARVEQRVGVTDFSVDYSSPAVKGREIWGALVPWDKAWRTGANAATKFTASNEFSFGDKVVPAGTYALYTVPGKSSWKVTLNKSAEQWGVFGLDPKLDVASVTVKAEAVPARERMTFIFSNSTDDGARLDLEWEKVRVSVGLKVDTKKLVLASIDKSMADAWRPHFTAARWLVENGGDLDRALTYADTSIAIKPTWWNNWVRAQALGKKGKTGDAAAAAQKATELGKGDNVYEGFFKGDVEKALAGWKTKS